MMNRFATVDRDGFGQGIGEGFEDEREMDMTANQQQQKITVNLEDAVLEEQKLYQILEVSTTTFPIVSLTNDFYSCYSRVCAIT